MRIAATAIAPLVLAAGLAGVPLPADAQAVCTTHADMVRQLEERHGERREVVAVTESGSLVEIYAHPSGKSWSVIVTLLDRRTCLMMSGRDWTPAKIVPEGPEA